jgi:hypothetical protein
MKALVIGGAPLPEPTAALLMCVGMLTMKMGGFGRRKP